MYSLASQTPQPGTNKDSIAQKPEDPPLSPQKLELSVKIYLAKYGSTVSNSQNRAHSSKDDMNR